MPRDYYEVLGVPRTATDAEIKAAYVKKARENHPDLNPGDKEAEARFKEIQQAYDVLGDPEKRRKYDQFGHAFEQAGAGAGAGPGGGTWTFRWGGGGPGRGGFEFEDLEDILDLDELLGRFRGAAGPRAGARRKAPPQEVPINVDFMTMARGGSYELRIQRPDNGEMETIKVRIPAGVSEGTKLRVPGKGSGGGDLYLVVHVLPHPYFRREGQDIHIEVPITIGEAVLGATIDVPTIDKTISVKVPPGTSSGRRLRLRGQGLPSASGTERGDQYVELKIVTPPSVDERSRQLIEEFARRNPHNPRADLGWR
ncbi:MAG: DnaJ domain-containing protein [Gemmatales bacterium]|nr:DnaJ domain-containing protein [Gemmatales bacterium]MDW8387427.1 DnaJ C-terminal domain-containing protein [Gemmatales bacterium]